MFEISLLHPKVVHFTIGIFAAAVLLEILAALFKKQDLKKAATWNVYLAALSAIFSLITGLLAASKVAHDEQAHQIMETHEALGYVILGIIVILAIWRLLPKSHFLGKLEPLHLVIAIIGLGVMMYSGYLGGEMVYNHGVGVAPVTKSLQSQGHEHGENATLHHESDQPVEKTEGADSTESKLPEHSQEKEQEEHSHDYDHSDHKH